MQTKPSLILGISIIIGLLLLGTTIGGSIVKFKMFERTVTVKGLAEKEVAADQVLWPIQYLHADNDLTSLYAKLEKDTEKITQFLTKSGFDPSEISISAPNITDKMAQGYGGSEQIKYRYSAVQTLAVYTQKVEKAIQTMTAIAALGKSGITFRTNIYDNPTSYMYTGLNNIKPAMIEEATKNARLAAQKFAQDSQSALGKIKRANQGQFSIQPRDKYTPHIKRIRVVSTIQYYLND